MENNTELPPENTISPLLTVKGLSTQFMGDDESPTVHAVNSISFDILPGETFALVGESGSGKSITAASIMRLLPSTARISQGEVTFNNINLLNITEREMRTVRGQGIGMIFQEPMTSLNPVMSIGEQIAEAVHNAKPKLDSDELYREVEVLLDLVGIKNVSERLHEYPHQFSGGMRQRVMIAIALAGEPQLLIADEPTTALDVTIQSQVLRLIKDIQKKTNMAVMLITHDLGVVHEIADRVAVMRHGEILETAASDAFFNQPQHSYSQQLFSAIPQISKRGQKLSAATSHQESSATAKEAVASPKNHSTETLLKIYQLKTSFPIKKGILRRTVDHIDAVNDVSLSLKKGKTLALVGESGSGKTTLAKTIIHLLNSSSGTIEFDGIDISQHRLSGSLLNKLRSELQIVFQDPYSSMNPRMRVKDILSEGMIALGTETNEQARQHRMLELMEWVGLDQESLQRYPHQFSGGQRQRIAIARALAVKPKLMICDEPTSALDVSVQAQILNLLKDLQQQLGIAYLFITHDISVVSYIADEVAVIYNGSIVEKGLTEQVILSPQHQYTKKLMAAVPPLYKKQA